MNVVDIVLVVILFYGLIRGFLRGFLAELASLVAFVAGVYGAIYFSHFLGDFLSDKFDINSTVLDLISFALTFVIIVFIISYAGKILTTAVNLAMLGLVNKLLGAAFGFVKIAFITSVIIMFFGSTQENFNIVDQETLDESTLYLPVKAVAPILLPSILREAKKMELIEKEKSEN